MWAVPHRLVAVAPAARAMSSCWAVGWLRRAWRWAWEVPPEAGPLHETWQCPRCGRYVEVETSSLMMKRVGLYLPPGHPELVALCHRQNGTAHEP